MAEKDRRSKSMESRRRKRTSSEEHSYAAAASSPWDIVAPSPVPIRASVSSSTSKYPAKNHNFSAKKSNFTSEIGSRIDYSRTRKKIVGKNWEDHQLLRSGAVRGTEVQTEFDDEDERKVILLVHGTSL